MGRSEGEVNMVFIDNKLFNPKWCVEIKWSNRYFENETELTSLLFFCKRNDFKAAVVTTIDIFRNKKIDDLELMFIPAAVYAYNVGAITLEKRS